MDRSNGALTKVLLYHVLSGKVMASTVLGLDGVEVETLLGQDVKVTIEDGKVYINDAEVIVVDVEATNGVIHGLDAVLVPDLTADDEVELPRTGGYPVMLMGLLAAGAGLAILKKRK